MISINSKTGRMSFAAIAATLVVAYSIAPASAATNNVLFPAFLVKDGHVSQAPLLRLPDAEGEPFSEVDGASTLVRTKGGVGYIVNTRGLLPGGAYTNWFVVFNRPEQCSERCACGLGDLANPFVEAGVFYATGRVADAYGQATFAAEIDYGELPDGVDQIPFLPLAAPISPRAEVQLVVRTHNQAAADAETRDMQLSSFNGGCGLEGCVDVQAAIHRSPFCKTRRGRW